MAVQREYLSPNEIAEYLGVSPFTIRRYIKLGELRAVKLLGGFRVHRDELQRFLKAHEVNPAEEALEPEEIQEASPPSANIAPSPKPEGVESPKRNGVEKATRAGTRANPKARQSPSKQK